MFKKWYYGVNNYVLELEQLQTRASVQNRSKKGSRAAPAAFQSHQGQPFRTSLACPPVARRWQGRKELDRSCSTKSVCTGFAPVALILFAAGGTPSAGARGPRDFCRPAIGASAVLRRVLWSRRQRLVARAAGAEPRSGAAAPSTRTGQAPSLEKIQGDFKEKRPCCVGGTTFPQTRS